MRELDQMISVLFLYRCEYVYVFFFFDSNIWYESKMLEKENNSSKLASKINININKFEDQAHRVCSIVSFTHCINTAKLANVNLG